VVGAYQKKLEEIAQHDDVELTVVVPPEWQDERGTLRLERVHTTGYDLRIEPIAFNGHFHLHYYPTLWGVVREVGPDVVHIDEEPYNLATFRAMRAARRLGARTVVFTWQNLQRRYPPPFRWMESYVLARTDALLTGNAEGVDVWRAKGYTGTVEVIPQFGVDPGIYHRITRPSRPSKPSVLLRRSTRRPSQSEMVIGYIGRLVPEKGIDILLEAVAQLRGPWELRILGSGPERDRLEKMAQWLGILPRVAFDLPIPSTQMPYYYSVHADALLLQRTRCIGAPLSYSPQLEGAVWPGAHRGHGLSVGGRRGALWRDPRGHRRCGLDLRRGRPG
jgi:glycosyltransferase involved in cell wall biosynthesis